jgi:iron complex outermembrane receptor protein
VESVSAEDIGKLPDSSIAESIARLPGLTAQRERGRATQVNIRGFAGDFAGTTLNGREQVSLGDNRGVEFDQYPSELLSAVTVYKTPDASLVGQGLSGTVDLQTVRPLSFDDRVVAVNYRFDQNKVNGENTNGNRYSFSYIDQFMDNKLGVAFGYAHLDSPAPGNQNEAWGYPSERWNGVENVPAVPGNPGVSAFGGGKFYHFDNNLQRDGLMATLQFKPTDFYETTLDLFYSKFKKTEIKSGVEFGTTWGQGIIQPGSVIDGNTAVETSWTNVKPVLRMDSNPINDKLFSLGWNNKFKINDNWSVTADFTASQATRNFSLLETYGGLKGNGTTNLTVTLDPSGKYNNYTWGTDFSDPSNLQLIDAGSWGQDGYLKDFEVEDKLQAVRLDATRTFDDGFISSLEFGVNLTDRTKSRSAIEGKLCIVACAGGDTAAYPGQSVAYNVPGSGIDNLASFSAEDLLSFYNFLPKFDKDIAAKNWTVDEKVTTYYTQLNIDSEVGDMPLIGNIGFQYVSVNQSSNGFSTYSGNPAGEPTEASAEYNDFLPSLNLSLVLPADQYLRFAAAKQMARPRMDDLRATVDVGICNSGCGGSAVPVWSGGGGNPELKPWLANAYDLSYEKYFSDDSGNKGYVSAAYFYKDLTSFIYRADAQYDYAGTPLPPPAPGQTNYPISTIGVINQPLNGTGGTMKGHELAVSLPFSFIWAPLDGFGLQASYSDTESSIPVRCSTSDNAGDQGQCFAGSGSEPLPGLSKYVSNTTLYYEKHGFSIRFSQRSRSSFRGEVLGFGGNKRYIDINGETVQDAQINYSFGEGTFENLTLFLQMSNIGDEPFTTSDSGDSANRPVQYFEYGRTTLLGFSYKF